MNWLDFGDNIKGYCGLMLISYEQDEFFRTGWMSTIGAMDELIRIGVSTDMILNCSFPGIYNVILVL